jgi:hypothetical protein
MTVSLFSLDLKKKDMMGPMRFSVQGCGGFETSSTLKGFPWDASMNPDSASVPNSAWVIPAS